MSVITSPTDRCAEVLAALVSIDSINPMGGSCHRDEPIERQAIELIEQLFKPHESRVTTARQTCSATHESLVITLPGDPRRPAALFESHIDTVPAIGWEARALNPRVDSGDLIGLGACDDKGSLTAMILALLELIEEGSEPPRTIVLVCAGDEEFAQTGIRRYLGDPGQRFGYGIFGEPTNLCPVVQHKGTVRWDITVHGRSAHTSRPELGVNAILGMLEVIRALQTQQELLQARWKNRLMTGPMITVTRINGGRTRNAVPDECTIAVDCRVLPGMNPADERSAIIKHLTSLPWQISHSEIQLLAPALDTNPDTPFCGEVLSICRQIAGHDRHIEGAPYGTDAAWSEGRWPSVVLGPGDIRFAHALDERISLQELRQAVNVYKQIMMNPFEQLT